MSRRRTPQLRDDVVITLLLPPETEDWADEALEACQATTEVLRLDDGSLSVTAQVGGNTNGLDVLKMVCDALCEALSECEVDPMEFTVSVRAEEPKAASRG